MIVGSLLSKSVVCPNNLRPLMSGFTEWLAATMVWSLPMAASFVYTSPPRYCRNPGLGERVGCTPPVTGSDQSMTTVSSGTLEDTPIMMGGAASTAYTLASAWNLLDS